VPLAATDLEAPAAARRESLVELYRELQDCQKCPLAQSRTTVVFGTGNADADLMFVGEAPGFHEDQQGKPFVGRAGKLLDQLLEEIGLTRRDCFVANVLKCRPPDNRDPLPAEIDACRGHLTRQIELFEPRVICTLGNFATKLLTGSPQGITRVRGVPQAHELGGRQLFLYPIFHPAAALRTTAMLDQLRADFQALPRLLAEALPSFGGGQSHPEAHAAAEPEPELVTAGVEPDQLDLFREAV
jgi:uracil-DNA glycosylase family 4